MRIVSLFLTVMLWASAALAVPLSVTVSSIDATCGTSNGSVTAVASGGTGSYTYLWESVGPATIGNAATANSLGAGVYRVTVGDGSTAVTAIALVQNTGGPIASIGISPPGPYLIGNFISLSGSATGGSIPDLYTWSWFEGIISIGLTQNITQTPLTFGLHEYVLEADDLNGCVGLALQTVTVQGVSPTVTSLSNQSACVGAPATVGALDMTCGDYPPCTAVITGPEGQVAQQTFSGSGTITANVLALAGTSTYTTTVTNSQGASVTTSLNVTGTAPDTSFSYTPAAPEFGLPIVFTFFNDGDATYTWNVTGATVGSGSIPSGQSTFSDTPNPGSSTYTLSATATNGCIASTSQVVDVLVEPLLANAGADAIFCGVGTGSLTATASGGVAPYTYSWSPGGQASATATGLSPGEYTVTVTDAYGVSATDTAWVISNALPTVSFTYTPLSPVAGSAIDLVGSGASIYEWFVDDAQIGLGQSLSYTPSTAGAYTYRLDGTDINGCVGTISQTIVVQPASVPSPLLANAGSDDAVCPGGNTGTLTATASGGALPYTYLWSSGQTSATITGLTAGTYAVTVTDSSGATATDTAQINVYSLPTVSFTYTPFSPVAGSAISLVGSSGLAAYAWFVDSAPISNLQNVSYTPSAAGTYTYRLDGTGLNGCVGTISQTIIVQSSSSTVVPVCGNGILEAGETCDDGTSSQTGCSPSCAIAAGYICIGSPSACFPAPVHGNGLLEPGETCDDGNSVPGDGCDSDGIVEPGFLCVGTPNICGPSPVHGNGVVDFGETCDDGNTTNGDGCDSEGRVEPGFLCVDTLKICVSSPVHGNGVIDFGESCDDGNTTDGDGCSAAGLTESGYVCPKPSELCAVSDAATGGGTDHQCNGCSCSATRSGNSNNVPLGDLLFLGLLGLISLPVRPRLRRFQLFWRTP